MTRVLNPGDQVRWRERIGIFTAGMAHPATRVMVEEYAVEHAFRSLKTVDLELRPVFHWTSRGRFGGLSSRFLAKFPSFWRNSSS
jgi:hypothetical protein